MKSHAANALVSTAVYSSDADLCFHRVQLPGLPLYLLLNLVPAWLKTEQIDLKAIGLLSLVQFPYLEIYLVTADRSAIPF